MLQMLLRQYTDGSWGYDRESYLSGSHLDDAASITELVEEHEGYKAPSGVEVKHTQRADESREDFFKRIGDMPKPNMYGSNESLDKLANDESPTIRIDVARQGYALEKLVHDKDWAVRAEVARQGQCLDILINDESWLVRSEVAKRKYGLDILANDPDWRVRFTVAKESNIESLLYDKDSAVRKALARKKYRLDVLVNDEDEEVRAVVARQGYALDKLAHDPSWLVRREVAKQGHALDKLVDDESYYVRKAVACHKVFLDKLASDKNEYIRELVRYMLGDKSIAEWWEQAPSEAIYYKTAKRMPNKLAVGFAAVLASHALGGNVTVTMNPRSLGKYPSEIVLDVKHSFDDGSMICIKRRTSTALYRVIVEMPNSASEPRETKFSTVSELLDILHGISNVLGEQDEMQQGVKQAICVLTEAFE